MQFCQIRQFFWDYLVKILNFSSPRVAFLVSLVFSFHFGSGGSKLVYIPDMPQENLTFFNSVYWKEELCCHCAGVRQYELDTLHIAVQITLHCIYDIVVYIILQCIFHI